MLQGPYTNPVVSSFTHFTLQCYQIDA